MRYILSRDSFCTKSRTGYNPAQPSNQENIELEGARIMPCIASSISQSSEDVSLREVKDGKASKISHKATTSFRQITK